MHDLVTYSIVNLVHDREVLINDVDKDSRTESGVALQGRANEAAASRVSA